jgi:hypothetical protein
LVDANQTSKESLGEYSPARVGARVWGRTPTGGNESFLRAPE